VRLLHELGDEDVFLVVLGGLVPQILARGEAPVPEHLGTTDVDVLLITHVDPDADLGGVERALERLDFKPDPNEDGWRWRGPIDGVPVKLEFLCDLPDYREGEVVSPSGCGVLSAQNLRGTGYVSRDFAWEELKGELADGTGVAVRGRFAGLVGYLLSKCVAVRTRAATKDYYDLVKSCGTTGPGDRSRQRTACSTASSPTSSTRYGPPSSRYESVTSRRLTAVRSAMPSRQGKSSPGPTRQRCGPTPSTWSSDSSRRLLTRPKEGLIESPDPAWGWA
jgi:hypothetical protein